MMGKINTKKSTKSFAAFHLDGGRNLSCKKYGVHENWLKSPFANGTKGL
jgi:hypothetical protein